MFGCNELQVFVCYDYNGQFGNYDIGVVVWGYWFDYGLCLLVSYGSVFYVFMFNDLYYFYGSGNLDFKLEILCSVELGVIQQCDGWNWVLNVYQIWISQLIVLDSNYFLLNISCVCICGIEG